MNKIISVANKINQDLRITEKSSKSEHIAPILDKLGAHPVSNVQDSFQSIAASPSRRVDNWFTAGPEQGVEGTRADKAHADFGLPGGISCSPVIVAVIDSGVDIEHEDLRGAPKVVDGKTTYPDSRIWTNKGEIPGDGVDNDGNGYADDVNGWNFLGSYDANGEPIHVGATTLEATREFIRLRDKAASGQLTPEEEVYFKHLDKVVPDNSSSPHHDLKRDRRAEVIGDDQYDFSDKNYGNHEVEGPDAFHGTHVSGIIGAIRDNAKGILGVAADVQIMAVRAVPNGDEYDKDVANAIRYAADNGAQIINMSFGKAYASGTEGKAAVDAAVKYALANGVKLFVHAAGNDGQDLDEPVKFGGRYPNDHVGDDLTNEIPSWIEVGASTSKGRAASFSNHGDTWVDVFAPGQNLTSTVPGNGYRSASGTSMASPAEAGVAAIVLSVHPELTGKELETVLCKSVRPLKALNGKARNPGVGDVVGALKYAAWYLGKPIPSFKSVASQV